MIVLSFPILKLFKPVTEKDIKSHFSKINADKLINLMGRINKQLNDINQVAKGQKIPLDQATRGYVDSCVKPIIHASFKASAIAAPHLKTFLEIVNDEHKHSPKDRQFIKTITDDVVYFLQQFAGLKVKFKELDDLINYHFEQLSATHTRLIPAMKEHGISVSHEQSMRLRGLCRTGLRQILEGLDKGSVTDITTLETALDHAEKLSLRD